MSDSENSHVDPETCPHFEVCEVALVRDPNSLSTDVTPPNGDTSPNSQQATVSMQNYSANLWLSL